MQSWMCRLGAVSLLVVAGLLGCGGGDGKKDKEPNEDEKQVKAQFEKLKKALDDRDEDKIWPLLDDESQEDAEKAAKYIKKIYGEADDKAKAELGKKYIMEEKGKKDDLDLAALTGKTALKIKPFHDKYDPIEEAELEKVEVAKGDKATVKWKSKEGDKGDTIFYKQKGEWKAHLMTPRG